MTIPVIQPLFKYFGHKDAKQPLENGGLKVLANRSLKATPPNEFNDPFEFSPVVRPSGTAKQQINPIEDRAFFDQHFPTHPKWRNFDHYLTCIRANKVALQQGSLSYANNFQDNLPQMASNTIGVICFSSEAAQPLMWAHYASAHTGLMLEFSADCPLFQDMGKLKVNFLEVDYPPDRVKPVYDPTKSEESLRQLRQIAGRKSIDWKYEAEYRVIVELSRTYMPEGSKLHLFHIDPSWIASVTFGVRCPEPIQTKVARLLTQSELKHIRRFVIRMHREKFVLERHEL
jgi:hypothetical protein